MTCLCSKEIANGKHAALCPEHGNVSDFICDHCDGEGRHWVTRAEYKALAAALVAAEAALAESARLSECERDACAGLRKQLEKCHSAWCYMDRVIPVQGYEDNAARTRALVDAYLSLAARVGEAPVVPCLLECRRLYPSTNHLGNVK